MCMHMCMNTFRSVYTSYIHMCTCTYTLVITAIALQIYDKYFSTRLHIDAYTHVYAHFPLNIYYLHTFHIHMYMCTFPLVYTGITLGMYICFISLCICGCTDNCIHICVYIYIYTLSMWCKVHTNFTNTSVHDVCTL